MACTNDRNSWLELMHCCVQGLMSFCLNRVHFSTVRLIGTTQCLEEPPHMARLWGMLDVFAVHSSSLCTNLLSPWLEASSIGALMEGFCTEVLQGGDAKLGR